MSWFWVKETWEEPTTPYYALKWQKSVFEQVRRPVFYLQMTRLFTQWSIFLKIHEFRMLWSSDLAKTYHYFLWIYHPAGDRIPLDWRQIYESKGPKQNFYKKPLSSHSNYWSWNQNISVLQTCNSSVSSSLSSTGAKGTICSQQPKGCFCHLTNL